MCGRDHSHACSPRRRAVADACTVQRLMSTPKTDAGCFRVGVEVAHHDDLLRFAAEPLLYESRCGDRLQLAFVLQVQLPVWKVIDEEQRADRARYVDLRRQSRSWKTRSSRSHIQVQLMHLCKRQRLPIEIPMPLGSRAFECATTNSGPSTSAVWS